MWGMKVLVWGRGWLLYVQRKDKMSKDCRVCVPTEGWRGTGGVTEGLKRK